MNPDPEISHAEAQSPQRKTVFRMKQDLERIAQQACHRSQWSNGLPQAAM